MGGKESVPLEIKGHPEVFYRGVEQVKLGRYHDSEIYFHQALRQHEGRAFWVEILNAYWGKHPKGGERKHEDDDGSNASTEQSAADTSEGLPSTEESKFQHTQKSNSPHSSKISLQILDFPLDENLLPILDYLRLMADIMNAYLNRELDNRNCNLALIHCCYLSIHSQLLFYLLVLWDSDNADIIRKLEDGTLFEVDESLQEAAEEERKKRKRAKKEKMNIPNERNTADATGKHNENILKSGKMQPSTEDEQGLFSKPESLLVSPNNSPRKKHMWKVSSKEEIPSAGDILMVRTMVYAFTRHYWMAVVYNYCRLSLLYVEKHCLPTEVKKIHLIHQHVLEASASCIWDLMTVLKSEGDRNALAASILKKIPKNIGYKLDADETHKHGGSEGGKSHAVSHDGSKASSQFFASLTGGMSTAATRGGASSAMQTFLALSISFAPTCSLMIDSNINIPLRLNIRIDTPKSKLCVHKIRPPGSYNICQYTNWFSVQEVFHVAGYNSYYLNQMLPYYSLPEGGEESSFMSILKAGANLNKSGMSDTYVKRDKNFKVQQISSMETQNFVDPTLKLLMAKTDLVKNQQTAQRIKTQKSYFNPLLKRQDMHTLKAIVLEESIFLVANPTLTHAKVLAGMGRNDEAEEWRNFILFAMETLYGKESQEYIYMNRIVDTYKA